MTTKSEIYDIPNVGCLLGIAYQAETSRLSEALADARLDITAAEYIILRLLSTRGPMQQCDISRALRKDKASVSRTLRSLHSSGLVTLTASGRKCSVGELSPQGKAMMPRLLEIGALQHDALTKRLSPRQIEDLQNILNLIIN